MKKRKGLIFLALLILIIIFLYSQNNWIGITRIAIKDDKVPAAFNGYKILQLSDLHGKTFGKESQKFKSANGRLDCQALWTHFPSRMISARAHIDFKSVFICAFLISSEMRAGFVCHCWSFLSGFY